MFNVDIREITLKKIKEKGCYFEHDTEMIRIRNCLGETLAEIIYQETNNSIIVLDNEEGHFAKMVKIDIFYERIVLFLYDEYGRSSGKVEINLN